MNKYHKKKTRLENGAKRYSISRLGMERIKIHEKMEKVTQSNFSNKKLRRWAVVTHTHMYTYESQDLKSKPTEIITLRMCKGVKSAEDDTKKENSFVRLTLFLNKIIESRFCWNYIFLPGRNC